MRAQIEDIACLSRLNGADEIALLFTDGAGTAIAQAALAVVPDAVDFACINCKSDKCLAPGFNIAQLFQAYKSVAIAAAHCPLFLPSFLATSLPCSILLSINGVFPLYIRANSSPDDCKIFRFVHFCDESRPDSRRNFDNFLIGTDHRQFPAEELYLYKDAEPEIAQVIQALANPDAVANIIPHVRRKVSISSTSSMYQFVFYYLNYCHVFSIPMKWNTKIVAARNWQHNLCKLFCVKQCDLTTAKHLLKDWIGFHETNYNEWNKGDHTICERIYTCLGMANTFAEYSDKDGENIALKIIGNDIPKLLDANIYQHGNNHGLMCDLCVLYTRRVKPELVSAEQAAAVAKRGVATYDAMFSERGVSLEHSLCYQEWNCAYGLKFLRELARLEGWQEEAKNRELKLIESTKQFLGAFLTAKGEYMPLGDSDREPQLRLLPFLDSRLALRPRDCLGEYVRKNGLFFWPEGFCAYRDSVSGIHLGFSCGRHSTVHKPDDELNFCLWIGEDAVFDTSGSAWALKDSSMFYKAETHSTILLEGCSWLPATEKSRDPDSRVYNLNVGGSIAFGGSHERMPGFRVFRFFEIQNAATINARIAMQDMIVPLENQPMPLATHRFVLAPGVAAEQGSRGIILGNAERPLCILSVFCAQEWEYSLGDMPFIGLDKTHVLRTKTLDITSAAPAMGFTFTIVR